MMFESTTVYEHTFMYTLRWIATQSPIYLVWIAGIFWALMTWKRHPRKSFLVMLVLALFLTEDIVWPFAMDYLLNDVLGGGAAQANLGDMEKHWLIAEICRSVLVAALWLVLFVALFASERTPSLPRGPDGEILPPEFRGAPSPK
jgi:hypothetical protein